MYVPDYHVLNHCLITGCLTDTASLYHRFDGIPISEMTEEQRLLHRLMRRYDKASRPVYEAAKPVVIQLGITLTQVLDMVSTCMRRIDGNNAFNRLSAYVHRDIGLRFPHSSLIKGVLSHCMWFG